jgi:hypothetical protein
LLQRYQDEFEIKRKIPKRTPTETGNVLVNCDDGMKLTGKEQTQYHQWVGKLLHMMCWSRPDIYNTARELSRFMTFPQISEGSSLSEIRNLMVIPIWISRRIRKLEGV